MKFIAATAAMVLSGASYAGEAVDYSAGDRTFEGYVAKAENPKGAVVLIHDWDGLTDYEKKRADMLAEQGYNAFAIDLYGKGVRPDTMEGNRAETQKLYDDRETMRQAFGRSAWMWSPTCANNCWRQGRRACISIR